MALTKEQEIQALQLLTSWLHTSDPKLLIERVNILWPAIPAENQEKIYFQLKEETIKALREQADALENS